MCVIFGLGSESGTNAAVPPRCILPSLDVLRVYLSDIHRLRVISILLIELIGLYV